MGRLFVLIFFLTVPQAFAAPVTLTYQGRIVRADGVPLEYSSVSFEFRITNPSGSCVIYREQKNGLDMTNSKGVFDTPIGDGTVLFPTDPSFNLQKSFENSGTLNCEGGTTYAPINTDGRLLRVKFHDGSGWKSISPDNIIRSVPYAAYSAKAVSANLLGTKAETDFVLKTGIPTCGAGYVLTSTSVGVLTCTLDTGGSFSTVNSITGVPPLSAVDLGAGAYSISASVGTTSGTLAAGNDSRIVNALQTGATAGGDLSGTYPNPTVTKIQNVGVSFTSPSSGQYLRYDGSQWVNAPLSGNISGNATGFTGSLSGDVSGTQSATVVDKIKGVGIDFSTAPTNGQFLKFNGTNWIASSTLPSSINDNLWSGSGANVYRATGLVGIGTNNPTETFEVHQNIGNTPLSATFINDAGGATAHSVLFLKTATSGGDTFIRYQPDDSSHIWTTGVDVSDDGKFKIAADSSNIGPGFGDILTVTKTGSVGIGTTSPNAKLHVAGSVIVGNGGETCSASLAGALRYSSSAIQFCNGTTWTTLGTGSGAGTVTSVATGTGLTGGAITSTGTISIADGGVGTTQLADGAVTQNKLETVSGLTAGSYGGATAVPAITVDVKGRITAISTNAITGLPAASGVSGEFLKSNGTTWSGQDILFSDIKNAIGGSAFNVASCAANQTVAWSSLTDSFTCQGIGSLDAAVLTTGTLDAARLPSSVTDGLWTASSGNAYRASGNVGIGTSAPALKLSVNGEVQLSSTGAVCNSTNAGALQYASGTLQLCNGTNWTSLSGAPAGLVSAFSVNSCPAGWLEANGATVSRTTYAALFSAVGTTFGTGDGSTTFRLPDLRGEFIRGWDHGRGVDSGRTFGSWQVGSYFAQRDANGSGNGIQPEFSDDAFASNTTWDDGGGRVATPYTIPGTSITITSRASTAVSAGNTISANNLLVMRGARPRNISLIYCISTATNTSSTVASTGTGTTNYIPKWTSTTGLGNSILFDAGTGIGIGTTTPTQALDVAGKVNATEYCIAGSCINSWPSSGGTVTNIATGTGLTGGAITSSGTISIADGGVGTTQLADGAVTQSKLETVSGLTAGSYGSATAVPAITVDAKGRVTAISTNAITGLPAASGVSGKFLKSNGTAWSGQDILFSDIKNSVGGSAFNVGSCAANQTVAWSSLTDSFTCQGIGSLDAAVLTTGTLDAARLPSSVADGLWTASSGNVHRSSGNVGIGTTTPTAKLEIGGIAGTDGIRFPDGTLQTSAAVTSGTNNTMVANWPDAILCNNGTNTVTLLVTSISSTTTLYRHIANTAGDYGISYSAAGNYASNSNLSGYNCVTNAWTITQLRTQGLAFNFVKGPAAQWLQASGNAYYTGNVGVGTSTPQVKLEVSDDVSGGVGGKFVLRNPSEALSSSSTLYFGTGSGALSTNNLQAFIRGIITQADPSALKGELQFWVNGGDSTTQAMTIKDNGNVGIGTTTAPSPLTVATGSAQYTSGISIMPSTHSTSRRSSILLDDWNIGQDLQGNGTKDLYFWQGSTGVTRFMINPSGNVGIGTASPSSKLHVTGGSITLDTGQGIQIGNWSAFAASSNTAFVRGDNIAFQSSAANSTYMYMNSAGNIGVGTISPGYKLDVIGNMRAYGITDSSDVRLKRDIQPLTNDLDKILNLQGVSYFWKDNETHGSRKQIGVIAQEVEKQYPELVETDQEGMKSVNYSHFIAPLIESIKTLYKQVVGMKDHQMTLDRQIASKADQSEIDALKAKNLELEKQNAELKIRLDKIEEMLKSK